MRKQMLNPAATLPPPAGGDWLDLEKLARVELTSEDPQHPVEAALQPGRGDGWRAAEPGVQTVRMVFDQPQRLRRILLRIEESSQARTQEFVLRWLPEGGSAYREIVRQQFNFSPPHTVLEVEDYSVELDAVAAVEVAIVPEIGGGSARASLAQLRLA